MPRGHNELLILVVRHLVPIDRERIQIDGSLRTFIKASTLSSTNERPRRNRDHLTRKRFLPGSTIRHRHHFSSGIRRRLLIRCDRRPSHNGYDGHSRAGQNHQQEDKFKL